MVQQPKNVDRGPHPNTHRAPANHIGPMVGLQTKKSSRDMRSKRWLRPTGDEPSSYTRAFSATGLGRLARLGICRLVNVCFGT